MRNTITQHLTPVVDRITRMGVMTPVAATGDRLSSKSLNTANLGIKAAGSPTVKTGGAAYYAVCKGRIVTKAGNTDMAALSGTVANGQFNVFAFFVDIAGNLTTIPGQPGATLNAVIQPEPPAGQAQLGLLIINPTGTGPFVGGTTALDDATVVPNAVYINTIGAYDPTILVN